MTRTTFAGATIVVLLGACVGDDPPSAGPLDAGSSSADGGNPLGAEAGADAEVITGRCNPKLPFGVPKALPAPLYDEATGAASLSADGLHLIYFRGDAVWGAHRPEIDAPFGAPTNLQTVTTPVPSQAPRSVAYSSDRVVVFTQGRDETGQRLWRAENGNVAAALAFEDPPVGANVQDLAGSITRPGGPLYFARFDPERDTSRLFVAGSQGVVYSDPKPLAGFPEPAAGRYDLAPILNATERVLYMGRQIGFGGAADIYRAERLGTAEPFGPAVLMPELNSVAGDVPVWASMDDCSVIISSTRDGGEVGHLYEVARPR